jgi:hypothetical protein
MKKLIVLLVLFIPAFALASSWEECHLEGDLVLKDENYIFQFKKTLKADGMMNSVGNMKSCDQQFSSGFWFLKEHAPKLKIKNPTTVIYMNYGAMGPNGPVTSTTYSFGELKLESDQINRGAKK